MYVLFAIASLVAYWSILTFVADRRHRQHVPSAALLHAQERSRLEQTVHERFLQQLRTESTVRDALLALCLPDASIIRQRAQAAEQDEQYIPRLSQQYIQSLEDTQLIEFSELLQESPTRTSLLLERCRAHQAGQRRFTSGQKLIAIAGLVLVCLMLVQPPWERKKVLATFWIGGRQEHETMDKQFLGYHPFWAESRLPQDLTTAHLTEHMERSQQVHELTRISYQRLLLQLGLLIIITCGAIWYARPHSLDHRTPRVPARGRWVWSHPR